MYLYRIRAVTELYPGCIRVVSGLYPGCIWAVSVMYLGCNCIVFGLYPGCISVVSWLYPGCIRAVSRLYLGCGLGCIETVFILYLEALALFTFISAAVKPDLVWAAVNTAAFTLIREYPPLIFQHSY